MPRYARQRYPFVESLLALSEDKPERKLMQERVKTMALCLVGGAFIALGVSVAWAVLDRVINGG